MKAEQWRIAMDRKLPYAASNAEVRQSQPLRLLQMNTTISAKFVGSARQQCLPVLPDWDALLMYCKADEKT